MKTITVDNNPFEVGMEFKNSRVVADFLDLKDKHHTQVILSYLSHYCEYKRDPDYKITITKVFDKVIPFKVRGFKYEVGQVITVNTGNYEIIDRYIGKDLYKPNVKCGIYKCRCLTCNYEFELPEGRITFGIGCPICGNRKLIPGIRTLWDDRSDLIKYLVNPEEAKNLTPFSNKRVLCKCPDCGAQKEMLVNNLAKTGFHCSYCSDGITYPNKFIRNLLKQLKVNYLPEKSFKWSKSRVYDEYLPEFNMIIENHGAQHYEDCAFFRKTLEEQQENDKLKMELAITNDIDNYIVLDCRESTLEWVKNSIMNSELPKILHFNETDIDWNECHLYASTNQKIKEICEAWKTNNCITELAKQFKHVKHTISNYLEIGAKCGYCDFQKSDDSKNGRQYSSQWKSKPIYCVTDDIYFFSKKECDKYYKTIGDEGFNGYYLYHWINKGKPYHNKLFRYVSRREYNEAKRESLTNNNVKAYGDTYIEQYVLKEEINNGKK